MHLRTVPLAVLLCLLNGVSGHPAGLECSTDAATRLKDGEQIMYNNVTTCEDCDVVLKVTDRSLSEVLPEEDALKTFVPGEIITLEISGLNQNPKTEPNGTYFVLRSSDGSTLTPTNPNVGSKCANQVFASVMGFPKNPDPTTTVQFTIPCLNAPDEVTFTLGWSNASKVVYLVTLKLAKSTTFDCAQQIDPTTKNFDFAWKVNEVAKTVDGALIFTHQKADSPAFGPMWLGFGLSTTGQMVSSTSVVNTAVMSRTAPTSSYFVPTDVIKAYELRSASPAGVNSTQSVQSAYGLKGLQYSSANETSWMKFTQNIRIKAAGSPMYNQINVDGTNTVLFAAGAADGVYHSFQMHANITWKSAPPAPVTTTKPPSPHPPPPPSPPPTHKKCTCCDTWCSVTDQFRADDDVATGSSSSMSIPGLFRRQEKAPNMNYTISWRLTKDQFIEVSIDIPQQSWVGFGLGSSMANTYAILCEPSGSGGANKPGGDLVTEVNLMGYSQAGFVTLTRELTEAALTQERDESGQIRTICQFKRNLISKNSKSANFSITGNNYIIAAGGSNTFAKHNRYMDGKSLNWEFQNSSAPPAPAPVGLSSFQSSAVLHSILMMVAWAYLLPGGLIVAKFKLPSSKSWFKTHIISQCLGLTSAFIGLGVIIYAYNKNGLPHFVLVHAKIGLVVMVIAGLQPLNALIRPGKGKENTTFWRMIWELTHKGLGYGVVILAWVNMFLSMDLTVMKAPAISDQRSVVGTLFYIGMGVMLSSAAVLTVNTWFNKNKKLEAGSKHPRYEGF